MSSIHHLGTSNSTDATIGWKKGVRVLGVAESFDKGESRSIMAGVVMRGDLRIDGFSVCTPTIGGRNSTEELVSMFNRLNRKDIRAWMLGGSVISWFNIVDISALHEDTDTPVICVSYHPSEGIAKYLKEYFPEDWKVRCDILESRARNLLDKLTIDGRVPEPIRVARTIAAGLHRDFIKSIKTGEVPKFE